MRQKIGQFFDRYHLCTCVTVLLIGAVFPLQSVRGIPLSEAQPESLAIRMAESVMTRHPNVYGNWDYVTGTVLRGFIELWEETGEQAYYDYIKNTVDAVVNSNGSISGYNMSDYNLDEIKEGSIVLYLYGQTGDSKYQGAADRLREQLRHHPRTSDGGFWHKARYPHQMWLDGLYMGTPFYAQYGVVFNEDSAFTDVLTQLGLMELHGRDPETGLLYHGWDESRDQDWADPVTGQSPNFWGRGDGWYAMALVDVLDYFPTESTGHDSIVHILRRLADAVFAVQDPESGLWWQVMDQGDREGNYLESSCAAMFTYAFAKAVRKNYISSSYKGKIGQAFQGMAEQFVDEQGDGSLNLTQTCRTAGLGNGRDGSYHYYVFETSMSTNDGKANGPFINAGIELWRAKQVIAPPENLQLQQTDPGEVRLNWDDASNNEAGFIVQRAADQDFQDIASVPANSTVYTDDSIEPLTEYTYRVVSYSIADTSYPSFSKDIITLNADGSPAPAFNPQPADGATDIRLNQSLQWAAGNGAESHDLYLGTSVPPDFIGNQTDTTFSPDSLESYKTYYWRVDEVNSVGTTQGPTWQFRTENIIEPGLVGHWTFDSESGDTAYDATAYGNNGAVVNGSGDMWREGVLNNAIALNGEDQYIRIPNDAILDFGDQSFSIAFWIKQSLTDKAQRYVIKGSHGTPMSGKRYEVYYHQDHEIRFAIDDNSDKTSLPISPGEVVTGEWEHLTAIRNTELDMIYLYVNGEFTGLMQDVTGDIAQGEDLLIGVSPDEENTNLQGMMDDLRIYSYALSGSEVRDLYNSYPTAISSNGDDIPVVFSLANYPNPFNAQTMIQYSLPEKADIVVSVYNLRGEQIWQAKKSAQSAGIHTINLDSGAWASGVYFYALSTSAKVLKRKMILLK